MCLPCVRGDCHRSSNTHATRLALAVGSLTVAERTFAACFYLGFPGQEFSLCLLVTVVINIIYRGQHVMYVALYSASFHVSLEFLPHRYYLKHIMPAHYWH